MTDPLIWLPAGATNDIFAGTIYAGQIAAGAIDATAIAAGAITTEKLAAGAVVAGSIASQAITAAKLAAGAVTAASIAADCITAGQIAAGAIGADEIAAGAITAQKIAAGTITADRIQVGSITNGQIAPGTITSDLLAAGAVTAGKIAAGAITADKIAAGSITGAQIAASVSLSAPNITGGNISGVTITGTAINGGTITGGILQTRAEGASSWVSRIVIDGVNDWERIRFESGSPYEMFPSSIFSGYSGADVVLSIWGPLSNYSGGGIWPQPSIELRGLSSGSTRISIDTESVEVTGNLRAAKLSANCPWGGATSDDGVWIQDSGSTGYRMKLYFDNGAGANGRLYVCRSGQRHYINADGTF